MTVLVTNSSRPSCRRRIEPSSGVGTRDSTVPPRGNLPAFSECPLAIPAEWARGRDGYLRIVWDAVRIVGPATQTFGAVLEVMDNESRSTFMSIAKIAGVAGLSIRTTENQLRRLREAGLLASRRSGSRRSSTHTLTADGARLSNQRNRANARYGTVPNWFLRDTTKSRHKWGDVAVYAYVVAALALHQRLAAEEIGDGYQCCHSASDVLIPSRVANVTGLTLPTVRTAVRSLCADGWLSPEADGLLTWPPGLEVPEDMPQSPETNLVSFFELPEKSGGPP